MVRIFAIVAALFLAVSPAVAVELDGDANGAVDVSRGGTNATTASGARASLGAGDVNGPASSTDNTLPRFDGTGGKTLQSSGIVVDDDNNMTIPGTATINGGTNGTYGWTATNNSVTRTCTAGQYQVFFEGGVLMACVNGTKRTITVQ